MAERATLRILAVGDVHLGRTPSRLPEGLPARELGPAAALERTVRAALDTEVALVLLVGDLVESIEDRFEAYGVLEKAVRTLLAAGVQVAGVAGNHDVEALPRLADRVEGFRLLGRGGRWERARFDLAGGALEVLAWSFAERRHENDPLTSLPGELRERLRDRDLPLLGLLHADLDVARSPYAPVTTRELERVPVDAWLLGHVHRPHALDGDRPLGYLGSLCGLDPGEPGLRGPRLVEVSPSSANGRIRVVRTVPVAGVRYEPIALDIGRLDACTSAEDALDALASLQAEGYAEVRERLRQDGDDAARVVLCRATLVGRGAWHALLAERGATALLAGRLELDGVDLCTEAVRDGARPALDLEELARGDDAPGRLARRLLSLARGDEAAQRLIERTSTAIAEFERRTLDGAHGVQAEEEQEVDVRVLLEQEGLRALEDLLAQRGGASS